MQLLTQYILSRRSAPLITAILGLVFVVALYYFFDIGRYANAFEISWSLAAVLGFQLAYVLAKCFAWHLVFRSQGIAVSFFESIRIFYIGAFLDFVLFPAVVSADLFKIGYLREYPIRDRLAAIGLFRVGTGLGYIVFLAPFLFFEPWFLLVVSVLAFGSILLYRRRVLRRLSFSRRDFLILLGVICLALTSIVFDGLRVFFLFSIFEAVSFWDFTPRYILSHVAGMMSALPMGLGVKDASVWALTGDGVSLEVFGVFLLLMRLSGEIFGGVVGWFFTINLSLHSLIERIEIAKGEKESLDEKVEASS